MLFGFLLIVPIFSAHPSISQSITRKAELDPISISYDELGRILEQGRTLIRRTNAGTNSTLVIDFLVVESRARKLRIDGPFTPAAFQDAPGTSTDVWYTHLSHGAPISEVTVRLNDFRREIEVTGSSGADVGVLMAFLASELRTHRTLVGGATARLILGMTIGLLGLLLSQLSKTLWVTLLGLSLSILGFIVVFGLWQIFPGVAIRHADTSFIVRHTAEITLIGTVLGAVSIAIALLQPKTPMRGRRRPRT